MKKLSTRLSLSTQTIRILQNDELQVVAGGSNACAPSGTSVLSGPSVIQPGTVVNTLGGGCGPSVIKTSGR